jgi:peptidoglycan DL-endopeptidase CwlO
VQYVGQVLGRAHSLFGDPPDSGAPAAVTAGIRLGGAGSLVRQAGGQVAAMSGLFPASYGTLGGWAGPPLDEMAGADSSWPVRSPMRPGAAVAAALTRRGAPYVWGAKGPSSFDCSGLTPRSGKGVPVPPGEVRAGDLSFPTDSFGSFGPARYSAR